MASSEDFVESKNSNGKFEEIKDPYKKVAPTREMLSKQAVKIAKQAEEHECFIKKVKYLLGVLGFGGFCFILGANESKTALVLKLVSISPQIADFIYIELGPQDVRYVYCLLYMIFVPLRWIYYRYKKWHYYLLDFCYYANTIFLIMILFYPTNEKLFLVCFSFAEGPLAWAMIVWRNSLVFYSMDKIVSVFIHFLPGLVFFMIRWWDPVYFESMHPQKSSSSRASWPYIESKSHLWTWLFVVPLLAYTIWQLLYLLIVYVLRRKRLLRDPEVMTSYRELSKKAKKANNIWWRLSGALGDRNRLFMYTLFQAIFTVATMALTVPIFMSYELHITFQVLKISAAAWNRGKFLVEVLPKQVILEEEIKKMKMQPLEAREDHRETTQEN